MDIKNKKCFNDREHVASGFFIFIISQSINFENYSVIFHLKEGPIYINE